ncbi:MAG: excinuclease ABC subunit UvrA [Candidatus Marinimicrobia bacterium]|jgi:excinuclease ABC subunit A|nr:excinuclease ABC subunit UvrA [Candidatus Neomarinimicrobiota bacterium]MBT3946433.1 excinuclease ABC subunit UvrA [Candidatus Neomarinimicrobiota bacterium]MBT4154677.1 excinuclease ABC subunit UvrA [Candidatus Neomarinimicrobiota bacterium]MBT5749176.1 excinuclease ABC subunit UvrA [Candidatus Neomarinimicrobiota bacterium]MBT6413056.1 excinuclease ABC subunit UvrA [Candidatus Neomarinimicrobiota bacterium]|tara:strand:- start:6537 stop:9380 length:2844 start_codon:yes stop_codon:yes gene_type:complete
MPNPTDKIIVRGARQHNLKNIDVEIPRDKFVVITGLSGSGKSSLAFDTIYAEGQRRYVESLSSYARQFLGLMEKPDMDSIEGLSPAISIEQKATARNPRSTVGTVTEIHDYLRLLYAHIGKPHCWKCGKPIQKQTVQQIVDTISKFKSGTKMHILAPLIRGRKGEHKGVIDEIRKEGFLRIRVDGEVMTVDDKIIINKNKKHTIEVVVDRLIMKDGIHERLTESIELALKIGSGLIVVNRLPNKEHLFSEHFACPDCELSMEELVPRMFSFNSPYGACQKCDGLGSHMEVDPNLIVPDKSKSLIQAAIAPLGEQPRGNWYGSILKSLSRHYNFNFTTPWVKMNPDVRQILLYGTGDQKFNMEYSSERWSGTYTGGWEGAIPNLMRRYTQTKSSGIREWIEQFMSMRPCSDCKGARLRKETLGVKINDKNIGHVSSMSIQELSEFFADVELTKMERDIADQILKEVQQRLSFLVNVGLSYLTLDRSAATLSGGEAQRIRLATQIGSQLMGVLYILDEPSIGLHPRDNNRLLNTLKSLRDIGNSILVVEHDQETIEAADYVIDLGPGAGKYGGEITFAGTPKQLLKSKKSLTGKYISGKKKIQIPKIRRNGNSKLLSLKGATGNNLKSIDVGFPLGRFIAVTGVSGSGKSTLVNETLFPVLAKKLNRARTYPLGFESIEGVEYLDKVVEIDQRPIGRTPRSNPATYTGVFTFIRDLFAKLPESKIRGYKPGRFSFNVKGGRCESCQGDGIIKIEMNFLPDVYVTCEVCYGKRYNRETLEVKYRGKSIAEVLDMPVSEALGFFKNIPSVQKKFQTLNDVGLGYIHLGQQATTLSGGEAQRVKLATELSKVSTSKTLYILDEPTTGLHFEDIRMLLHVLQRLVEQGNTVLVIEHNLDVIKTADWIIDLGPEGGDGGGTVLAVGTPEEIATVKTSYTGSFLKEILGKKGIAA